jgi:hypothetical protein
MKFPSRHSLAPVQNAQAELLKKVKQGKRFIAGMQDRQ